MAANHFYGPDRGARARRPPSVSSNPFAEPLWTQSYSKKEARQVRVRVSDDPMRARATTTKHDYAQTALGLKLPERCCWDTSDDAFVGAKALGGRAPHSTAAPLSTAARSRRAFQTSGVRLRRSMLSITKGQLYDIIKWKQARNSRGEYFSKVRDRHTGAFGIVPQKYLTPVAADAVDPSDYGSQDVF